MPVDDLLDTSADAGAGGADAGASGGQDKGGADSGAGNDQGAADRQAAGADAGKQGNDTGKDAGKQGSDRTAGKKAATAEEDDDSGEVDLELDDKTGDDRPKGETKWREDWREALAGGDEKLLKELKRFATIDNWAKSQKALRAKLSSGEYRRATLPEDATEEEKAAWRKENGIPDKPEEYGLPEVKGFEWSDADKTIANGFLAELHKAGTPKNIAQQALSWYAGFAQQQKEARAELDTQAKITREDTLRAEWAPGEYRQQINLAKQTLNDDEFMPKPLRQALGSARLADGRRLIDVPELTIWLAEQGLQRRGPGALISGEQGARMGSRIDELRKLMATDLDKYYESGGDRELAELLEKQSGMGGGRR